MLMFIDSPRSPYADNLPGETLLQEVSDVRAIEVAKNIDVGYTLLNRSLLGERAAIVAIGGFMSSLTTADRAWEGVQLAALERPILMLDLPGHGKSSPHSSRQIVDLCMRRSADSEAAPLVEAVQRVLGADDKVDYFGISHGSYMSMKSAELDPGDRVNTVFGIDLPAVKRRFTLGLQAGYIVADNIIGRKKYIEALKDTEFQHDFDAFKDAFDLNSPERAPSFIKSNTGLFILNLFASINARSGALDSWQRVMDNKSAKVSIITSENGHISDPEAIADFIGTLPADQQERSRQTVIHGEDHNIGITHLMPRAAAWAKEAYKS